MSGGKCLAYFKMKSKLAFYGTINGLYIFSVL